MNPRKPITVIVMFTMAMFLVSAFLLRKEIYHQTNNLLGICERQGESIGEFHTCSIYVPKGKLLVITPAVPPGEYLFKVVVSQGDAESLPSREDPLDYSPFFYPGPGFYDVKVFNAAWKVIPDEPDDCFPITETSDSKLCK